MRLLARYKFVKLLLYLALHLSLFLRIFPTRALSTRNSWRSFPVVWNAVVYLSDDQISRSIYCRILFPLFIPQKASSVSKTAADSGWTYTGRPDHPHYVYAHQRTFVLLLTVHNIDLAFIDTYIYSSFTRSTMLNYRVVTFTFLFEMQQLLIRMGHLNVRRPAAADNTEPDKVDLQGAAGSRHVRHIRKDKSPSQSIGKE